ncbi:hypothetical protein K502DRAFT_323851 [Neoconidiobolus thromboides FSU 785]|nr:hypothetical protein K502DRAFT_323851 [Neoconidiobolus thromboides FSU 785]
MKLLILILFLFVVFPISPFPLQRRANTPRGGLLNIFLGGGSDGGLLEILFNGSGPIGGLAFNAARISSGEVGSGNNGLRGNLLIGGSRGNKKEVGNGIVNSLPTDEENFQSI